MTPLLELSIRTPGPGDLEALARLNAEVQELHFANRPDQFKPAQVSEIAQWFAQLLENPSAKVWLAERAGAVVGYVVVLAREGPESPFCPARSWWNIDQVGVQAAVRGAGVGRALVDRVVSEARAQGVAELELSSWSFNQDAQRAFRRLGFVPKVVRFELRVSELPPGVAR